jgi:predicted flap endonuclease-1-like 5' DNA nuclease
MIVLIGEILGCLFIAAGIGGVVGWLLRRLSTEQLSQQVTATLRIKEQLLEKARQTLKAQSEDIQLLESRIMESEDRTRSSRQELSERNDRFQALQEELTVRTQRLSALEAEEASRRLGTENHDPAITAAPDKNLQQAYAIGGPAVETNAQELLDMQQRIAELEAAVLESDRLRARVTELEPAQGRVHWLEVQLSDREAEHRAVLHRLESQLAERDRRIASLEHYQQQLQEQEAALTEWDRKYAQALSQHEAQIEKFQKSLATQSQLQIQHQLDDQLLHEKTAQIENLQHRIHELDERQQTLASHVELAEKKDEEITRLQKRLADVQAALRIKTDGEVGALRQKSRLSGSQLSLEIEQAKPIKTGPKDGSKDDLSKIHGIGPAFARTLNKMGLHTYVQIARWTPEDIEKVAKKLYTAPERIKRDNWISEAKKEHYRKYGEQI